MNQTSGNAYDAELLGALRNEFDLDEPAAQADVRDSVRVRLGNRILIGGQVRTGKTFGSDLAGDPTTNRMRGPFIRNSADNWVCRTCHTEVEETTHDPATGLQYCQICALGTGA